MEIDVKDLVGPVFFFFSLFFPLFPYKSFYSLGSDCCGFHVNSVCVLGK